MIKILGDKLIIGLGAILIIAIGYYIIQLEFIIKCELGTDVCYNGFGHKIYIGHWFGELINMNFLGWTRQIIFYAIIPNILISPFILVNYFND